LGISLGNIDKCTAVKKCALGNEAVLKIAIAAMVCSVFFMFVNKGSLAKMAVKIVMLINQSQNQYLYTTF
jgi:hypothetical protein